MDKKVVCFFVGTHGDWGGASRIIFNIIRNFDHEQFAPIVMLSGTGEICAELDKIDVRYEIWPNKPSSRIVLRIGRWLAARKFFKCNRVDLVVAAYGCLGWKPVEILAARALKIPIVQHCQRVIKSPCPYSRFSAMIFTSSEYISRESNFKDVIVIPMTDIVDIDRFSSGVDVRSELGIPADNKIVTFLGRKRRCKGLDKFVDMCEQIHGHGISFIVATQRTGKPNEDTYSDEEFAELMRRDRRLIHVDYRGDIENIYAISDVIVMPSRDAEPCPAVVLEAAASGKPIVAYNVGATSEFVIDKKTGFLCEDDDIDSLVQQVKHLLNDSELRTAAGTQSVELARQRFFAEPIKTINTTYFALAVQRG